MQLIKLIFKFIFIKKVNRLSEIKFLKKNQDNKRKSLNLHDQHKDLTLLSSRGKNNFFNKFNTVFFTSFIEKKKNFKTQDINLTRGANQYFD